MTLKRILLLLLAVIIILPLGIAGWFLASFDPNAYAPQIEDAVQKATGRTLTLGAPIKMALSLTPSIETDHVTVSNPAGFADANLLSLSHLEAKIALLPLLTHKVDIIKLVLVNPTINLQTNAAGQADWDFANQTAPSPAGGAGQSPAGGAGQSPAGGGGAPPGASNPYKIILQTVDIQNAAIAVKDATGKPTAIMSLADLTAKADSASAPLNITAQATYNNIPVTLTGTTGPVERFSGIGSGPWPVNLTLAAAGATASIQGNILHPRTATGYNLALNATIPALEAFQPAVPAGLTLPPIHHFVLAATVKDQGSTMPFIGDLSVKTGASDLSSYRLGLSLTNLDFEMASLNTQPAINAAGVINNIPLTLTGSTGSVAQLLNPAWFPATAQPTAGNFPINLQAAAGDAKFTAAGGIATPANLAGVAINLTAAIPDLSALSPLAGTPLPAWKNLQTQATIIDPGGMGIAKAAGLDSLTLTMDNAALGGDASLTFGHRPDIQIALKGQQIDLDALLAAWPSQNATPNAPKTPAPQNGPLIPTAKLPLDILKNYDANIQLAADSMVINKATYTAIQGQAALQDGVLTINPLTGILPGGDVSATAILDTTKAPAAAHWTLNAPALALGPFLKSLNLPHTAEGTIQVQLNASGTGDSPHEILSTVNGELGLASVNFIVDGAVLDAVFGSALRAVHLPADALGAQGPVPARCFAVRVDAQNGTGTIRALTLDSSRLQVQGGGHLNFGDETLGVILRPQLAVGLGNQIGVPVEIGGTFTDPRTQLAPLGAVQDAAKSALGLPVNLAQQIIGNNTVLNDIASTLGVDGGGDVCPAALALGRLGQPGPAAAALPAANDNGVAGKVLSGPKNLLDSLFSK
jgi:AsmA protein